MGSWTPGAESDGIVQLQSSGYGLLGGPDGSRNPLQPTRSSGFRRNFSVRVRYRFEVYKLSVEDTRYLVVGSRETCCVFVKGSVQRERR